jgi:hypothetical protein
MAFYISLLSVQLVLGQLHGRLNRIRSLYFYVRFHANAFPIGFSKGDDHLLFGNSHAKVIVDAMKGPCVGPTPRSLAD